MKPFTLEISTRVFGLGIPREAAPIAIAVASYSTNARELIAAHVKAELTRAETTRNGSLALHYLLDDDLRTSASEHTFDVESEVARACTGLTERRYMLIVDGTNVTELDLALQLTDRSVVNFVRLVPLIGG